MDVAFLLDKYFKGAKKVSIDVFDAQTLNTVYKDVINDMTSHFGIEISILQALSIFREGELEEASNMQILHNTLSKYKPTKVYNLNVIISVGYRVKSKRGTQFRIWATGVLKDFILRGYAFNQRMRLMKEELDTRLNQHEKRIEAAEKKLDFFVRTNQPPVEGVFFEGLIFDAYRFVETLVKSAQREIIQIDNYVDATVFDLLEKRGQDVDATIYTEHVGQSLQHLQQLNQQQYGRRLFAFERMGIDKSVILSQL